MIRFRLAKHTVRTGDLVEVWNDDEFIAAIYPNDRDGALQIVSKHFRNGSIAEFVSYEPNAVEVRIPFHAKSTT